MFFFFSFLFCSQITSAKVYHRRSRKKVVEKKNTMKTQTEKLNWNYANGLWHWTAFWCWPIMKPNFSFCRSFPTPTCAQKLNQRKWRRHLIECSISFCSNKRPRTMGEFSAFPLASSEKRALSLCQIARISVEFHSFWLNVSILLLFWVLHRHKHKHRCWTLASWTIKGDTKKGVCEWVFFVVNIIPDY